MLAGTAGGTFPLALTMIGLRTRTPAATASLSAFAQSTGYVIAGSGPVLVGVLHDATGGWAWPFVLVFALLAFAGLATSLFAPRRRLWLRLTPGAGEDGGRTVVTVAGLARGDDVGLQPELDRVLAETLTRTADRSPVAPRGPTSGEATP